MSAKLFLFLSSSSFLWQLKSVREFTEQMAHNVGTKHSNELELK